MTAVAASLLPLPCAAQDDPLIHGSLSLGVGVFFGYQFAGNPERSGFEWGFEGYATQRYGDVGVCSSGKRWGFGPIVQLGIKGVEDPRLTLAIRGGGEAARGGPALTGELGASYRFGSDPGPSLHVGVMPELSLFVVGVRHQLFRNETWVGGGVRYLPSFGEQASCVEGRPLRLQDAKCVGVPSPLTAAGTDAELAAAAYAADAQMECVSISAFVQLALELMNAGAPRALIERALIAAEDELRHTVLCGALAAQLRAAPAGWQPAKATLSGALSEPLEAAPASYVLPEVCARRFETRQALLERLAVESYEDGCVGEAVAARQLVRSAELAADSSIAGTLRRIARDEFSHAQLAWDVLRFCVAEGGASVQAALQACAKRVRALPWMDDAAPDLQRFGRMQPAELTHLAHAQVEQAYARARALQHSHGLRELSPELLSRGDRSSIA